MLLRGETVWRKKQKYALSPYRVNKMRKKVKKPPHHAEIKGE